MKTLNHITIAAATLILTACSPGALPTDLDSSSAQAGPSSPLSLSTAGQTSVYVNQTMQLYVYGGVTPYRFIPEASVSATYAYTAPSTPGTYTITVVDAANTQAAVTVTVSSASPDTGAPVYTAPTKPIFRFFNSVTGIHSFSDQPADSQGGVREATAYLVLVNQEPGSVPFFRCGLTFANGVQGFYNTIDPACEGQQITSRYQLGYVYTAQNATGTLLPIYRFVYNYTYQSQATVDHIDKVNDTSVPGTGWSVEGVFGYVPIK